MTSVALSGSWISPEAEAVVAFDAVVGAAVADDFVDDDAAVVAAVDDGAVAARNSAVAYRNGLRDSAEVETVAYAKPLRA